MSVFGMGPLEIVLIVVLALIVFGPARLPEIMGQVGKAIADFRRATSELSDEFNRTIQAELKETRAAVDDARSTVTDLHTTVTDIHASVNSAVTGTPAPVRTAVPAPLEALPAANGTTGVTPPNGTTSGEPHIENGTNGSVVADATQWGREASASPSMPPASASDAAVVAAPSPSDVPSVPVIPAEPPVVDAAPQPFGEPVESILPRPISADDGSQATRPSPPASSPAREQAPRDELLPPY